MPAPSLEGEAIHLEGSGLMRTPELPIRRPMGIVSLPPKLAGGDKEPEQLLRVISRVTMSILCSL